MKKALALVLCIVILACGVLTSCVDLENEDKGATIPVYMSSEIRDFDPANAMTDEASVKILSLVYEGLTKVNEKGKVVGSAAKSWTYKKDELNGTYVLQFELYENYWSDGRQVSADDFVFAWKRIMEPEFQSEACAMLYQIKNAKEVKLGDASIDDLGVYSADTTVFQVEFTEDIDVDEFLLNCASPYLFPLREDAVNKVEDWATNTSVIVTNGPFTVRELILHESLIIERSQYYRRDVEKDSIKKNVTPYRLKVNFNMTPDEQMAAYEDGSILYIGEIPLSSRNKYKDSEELVVSDTMTTATLVFNNTKFNKDQRNGLSKAIDRNALAQLVVFAEPATGMVNGNGIFENKDSNTSFASVSGTLISASADTSAAKSLVSGISGTIKLAIRPDEVDIAVANYIKAQWEALGLSVEIVELESKKWTTTTEYDVMDNLFADAYTAGDFDVMLVDWVAQSANAWALLAPFAKQYSGNAKDLAAGQFDDVPHVTGYDSEEYNTLMDEIFALSGAEKTAKLHEAEKLLVEDMPVAPLFTYKNAYLASENLTGLKVQAWEGFTIFNKATNKLYDPETTAAETVAEPAADDEE